MSTALAEREPMAPVVTSDQLDLVKRTIASGASEAELKLYLYDCQRQGVHPLDRLLHFTKRGGRYTPVTSIDLMRTRAADTGEYAGSDDATFATEYTERGTQDMTKRPHAATVTVWRLVQGQRCAFTATARWNEYCPPAGQDQMWQRMSFTMLAKCAEALALRKGFPRQLAGLYAKEEMDQAGPVIEAPAHPSAISSQEKRENPAVPTGGEPSGLSSDDPAPAGYVYLSHFHDDDGWARITLPDGSGGSRDEGKTKRPALVKLLREAWDTHCPVQVAIDPQSGYVESVVLYAREAF